MDIVTGPIHVTTALAYEHRRDIERELHGDELGRPLERARTAGQVPHAVRAVIGRVVAPFAATGRLVRALISEIGPWPGALARPPIVVAAEKRRRGRRAGRPALARRARSRRAAA